MDATTTIPAAAPVAYSQRVRWLADASLLGLAAGGGATFFMVKDATREFPVLAFLAIRFCIASLALLPLVLQARRWPTRAELRWGLLAGGLFCLGYIAQTFSLRLIDSGRTGFFTGLYVILVPILALFLLRHALTKRIILGAALALGGMTLLSYAPGSNFLGDVLAFLCALCFAGQILAVEKFPRGSDWRIMALIQSACVAVISAVLLPILAAVHGCSAPACAAVAPFTDAIPPAIPPEVWAVAGFTGLLATAAGLAIQVWAQRILPPSDTAIIFAMESPFSALFGALFLAEVLSGGGLLGCGLILAGMLVTTVGGSAVPQDQMTVAT
jgi:drug/metabolite transporter (DMT)-like permease